MARRDTGAGAQASVPSLVGPALDLANEGLEVFPCNADKAPRTPSGFHDATSDLEVVKEWDWDDALIGAAIPSGQVVLDVDPRNGGDDTMRAFKEAGLKLPRTRVVETGSGGRHYYFKVPPDVELRAHLGHGVDVKRAGRGYVIVPPSPGYRLQRSDKPAKLPDWLLDALLVPEHDGAEYEASDPKFMPWEDGTRYGSKARDAVLGQLASAPAGGRNDALNKAAFSLAQLVAGGELDEDSTRERLEEVAARIGLSSSEIAKTISSGWGAGLAEPRQAPLRDDTRPAPAVTEVPAVDDAEAHFWLDWLVDEEPPEFWLDPMLPKNAYVLVYGPTEASKSMVWNALGAEASRHGIRTTVYSLENPPHVDRDRLRRLSPDPEHFRATNQPLDLNDPHQFQALLKREAEWGADLILIDTYSHAFASRSEDGNARAIEFARRVRLLMHETGASVVVVDHTGYENKDEPRDASAKRQQVDVAILMQRVGEWKPGKAARFQMENKKAARFGNPFTLVGEVRDGEDRALELAWVSGGAPKWA